ncbi:MAG TPA: IPT/TIG domain-containing protein [Terriglobia bacterium]|nr:IPT/TIG domain-containing protein [Terriglobia bacterium]
MRRGVLQLVSFLVLLAAFALAQAGPKLTSVEPTTGKVGDSLTVIGEDLGKETVQGVLLSDEEKDYPAEVLEQTAQKIVFKVPEVRAGGYNVSLKVGNNIYIQPIRFTVQ